MKSGPTVREFMTVTPHTIGIDQPLAKAEKVMREHRIRHLPVLQGGHLVGVISDRDIKLVESLKDVDPEQVAIEEAFTPEPFITSPDSMLVDVCKEMVSKKYGCALVTDHGQLVGIFTGIDALGAVAQILKQ